MQLNDTTLTCVAFRTSLQKGSNTTLFFFVRVSSGEPGGNKATSTKAAQAEQGYLFQGRGLVHA